MTLLIVIIVLALVFDFGTEMAQAQANRLGVEIQIEKITDFVDIAKFGIASTPGVVIDGKVVHAGGLPKPEDMAKWLAP